jgi:hypothetical protein
MFACSDYDLQREEQGATIEESTTSPVVEVDPTFIDFGTTALGVRTDPQVVTVRNVGDAPLGLRSISVDASQFEITATAPTTFLPPETETEFAVAFLPGTPGEHSGEVSVATDDPVNPVVLVDLVGRSEAPDVELTPYVHDFGTLEAFETAEVTFTVSNVGSSDLHVSDVTWTSTSGEMTTDAAGAGAFVLAPGESRDWTVWYAPNDDLPDEGSISVWSDDPDEPVATAQAIGNGVLFEGFSTGWYIVDDNTNYETTSSASHVVDFHGDPDGYWYEPSGARGLVDSSDPITDFAILRDYVIARAGAPTPVTGALTFRSSSTVPSLTYASFSYIVCDFWIDPSDDPADYEVQTGTVDDGLRVMVNGEVLGDILLGNSGRWSLDGVGVPGAVNTLAVILMDNAQVDKYVYDLAFLKDGVIVEGS